MMGTLVCTLLPLVRVSVAKHLLSLGKLCSGGLSNERGGRQQCRRAPAALYDSCTRAICSGGLVCQQSGLFLA